MINKLVLLEIVAVAVLVSASGTHLLAQCLEEQKLIPSEISYLGSVSVDDRTIIVGAPFSDCSLGNDCGVAYTYRFNGISWEYGQTLIAADREVFSRFGYSISISGDTAMLSSPYADCTSGSYCGDVFVFRFDGTNWIEQQKLIASDATRSNLFGHRVSLNGDTAVVTALRDDCAFGNQCGSAYVFRFNGSSWIEEQKLTASDADTDDFFGQSVTMRDDTIVVGAYADDCTMGVDCGAAYVYRFNGSSWIEEQKLTASNPDMHDHFGQTVSMSEGTIMVGSHRDNCLAGSSCGSVFVFRFNGSSWIEEQKLTASDADTKDTFGLNISLSGDTVLIGAPNKNCADGIDCGAAYVFRFDGNIWTEERQLTASDQRAEWSFGGQLDLSMGTAVVRSRTTNCPEGSVCGGAYVYDLEQPCLSCGNGNLDQDEECDDGNTISGDGCDANCIIELGACCTGVFCNHLTQTDCQTIVGSFFGLYSTCNQFDEDGDGLRDECDACPSDPNKIEPGICGCGNDDNADSDGDGVLDCDDQCHGVDDSLFAPECVGAIPTVSEWGLVMMTLLLLTGIKLLRLGKHHLA